MGSQLLVVGASMPEVPYRIEGFPLHCHPVRYPFFSIRSSMSGVGGNVGRALVLERPPLEQRIHELFEY